MSLLASFFMDEVSNRRLSFYLLFHWIATLLRSSKSYFISLQL